MFLQFTFIASQLLYYNYPLKKFDESTESSDSSPIRSITSGRINTSQKNLNSVLHKELNDVSADLSNKVEQAIDNVSHSTPNNFKEVIIIKKRILTDGKRRVVNLNVSEKLVPKMNDDGTEFKIRAMLAGVLFLVAGLVFTSIAKMYQIYMKRKYLLRNEGKTRNTEKY